MRPLRRTDSNPYRETTPYGKRSRSSYPGGQSRAGQNRYPDGGNPAEKPGRGYRDLDSARMEENGLGSDWHQSWDREDTPDPDRMTAGQWILVVLLLVSLVFLVFMGIYWFFLR